MHLSKFVFIGPSLDKIYGDFKNLKTLLIHHPNERVEFNKIINLKNIYFNYPNSSRRALKNISLSISANTTVGFVGATGSGKTTIVDIILGLLEAQKGNLNVDGKVITEKNKNSWQSYIGYVPQHIFLSDDTIAANIAFGVAIENINYKAVENAANSKFT